LFPLVENNIKNYKIIWLEKGLDVDLCPNCKKGKLIFTGDIEPTRGPPYKIRNHAYRF